MKAIVCPKYGPPEVLQRQEVAKPIPADNEVLVEVLAASVNPYDWHNMRADPFLIRLMGGGLLKPQNAILGTDVAGRVEAVGSNVTQFQPGDEVFADLAECGWGAFAEYVCAPEAEWVLKPANVTFEQAASVPMAAGAALRGLRDRGQIQSGQSVMVNGASGGVGTFAVQIAKAFGAEVTGVCGTRNLELVRSLGADHVIDYTQEDFTQNGQRYDMIIDAVGNCSLADYKRSLTPEGICGVIGFSSVLLMAQVGLLGTRGDGQKIGLVSATPNPGDLAFISELLEEGKVVPIIDRRYPLHEVTEAIRYLEAGHTTGKVVITIDQRS